jgi:hypothetical protein
MPLHIQNFLRNPKNNLEDLTRLLGVEYKVVDGKVVINYSMFDSPKAHPIVKECRGLILYEGSWDIASMAFERFFNLGEGPDQDLGARDLSKGLVYPKLDGTMCSLWFDRTTNKWTVSTRSMVYADGAVGTLSTKTFKDLFWEAADATALPGATLDKDNEILNSRYTYVFELTSPENRIVTPYTAPQIHLLTARNLDTLDEVSHEEMRRLALAMNVWPILPVKLTDWKELLSFPKLAPTDEGYVIAFPSKEGSHRRLKVKNPAYLAIAHMVTAPTERNFMDLVRTGAADEFLVYYPEYTDNIKRLSAGLQRVAEIVRRDYVDLDSIKDRKSFAIEAVKRRYPSVLFAMRDGKVTNLAQDLLLMPIDALLSMIKRSEGTND